MSVSRKSPADEENCTVLWAIPTSRGGEQVHHDMTWNMLRAVHLALFCVGAVYPRNRATDRYQASQTIPGLE
jgi:hypothetical protein